MMGASGTFAHDAVGSGPAVVFIHAFPLNRPHVGIPKWIGCGRKPASSPSTCRGLDSPPISPASKPYGGDRRHGGRHHPAEEAQSIATNVPKDRFVPIDGAGHLKNLEAPDEFTAVVRGLPQKVPPP